MSDDEATGGRGRPRDSERHRAVVEAARRHLAADGYPSLTISKVAADAGVSRQLVHRWWPNRAALVEEAIYAAQPEQWPETFPEDPVAAIRQFVSLMVGYAARPEVTAGVLGLMTEGLTNADLRGLESQLLGPLQESFTALQRAVAPEAPLDPVLTLNTLRAAIVMQLFGDATPSERVTEHLTALVAAAWGADRR